MTTTDPNQGLIGKTVTLDGEPWEILGTAWIDSQYLLLKGPDGDEIVRQTGLVTRQLAIQFEQKMEKAA